MKRLQRQTGRTLTDVTANSNANVFADALIAQWPRLFVGLVAFFVGLIGIVGFVLRIPALVLVRADWGGLVLMTSICVLMVGVALLSSLWDTSLARGVRISMGVAIFLIAALTLAEGLTGRNLGIDTPALHAALLPDYPAPGRMAPNTTFNFLLLGPALVLSVRSQKRFLLRTALVAVFLVAFIGFVGYCLSLRYFYVWYSTSGLVRMSLPSSLIMMLLPFGIWSIRGSGTMEPGAGSEGQELRGIFRASALVLLATAAATTTASFSFMQDRIFHATSDKLSELAHNDAVLIEQALEYCSERAAFAARDASIPQAMRQWNTDSPTESTAPIALRNIEADLLAHGFSGVLFLGSKGQRLQMGTVLERPELRVALHDAASGELIWHNAYYLSTHILLRDQSGTYGEMVAQQPISMLDRLAAETMAYGRTSSLGLCTKSGIQLECFPQRYRPLPFTTSPGTARIASDAMQSTQHGLRRLLPMSRALAGLTGTVITLDNRRVPVMASYTPIAHAPLGFVLKMDTTEIYEPVRHGIEFTVPLIILMILASLRIMQWRLKPLVAALVQSREQIRQLALHDSLTGLPNRVLLQDRLQMAIVTARRNGGSFALAVMDVDGFKQVNDTFGHATGDLLLQTIAKRLQGCMRASDTVARMGGDEFVLVLAGTPSDEAIRDITKKIYCAFSIPTDLGTCQHFIRLSMGVARYPPAGKEAHTLMQHADSAMYSAKQSGGNRCEIFNEPMEDSGSAWKDAAEDMLPIAAQIA